MFEVVINLLNFNNQILIYLKAERYLIYDVNLVFFFITANIPLFYDNSLPFS